MIIVLFKLIIVLSIWVLGLTICTQEHMVFYNVRVWAERKYKNGSKWMDSLIICEWCMPSLHSPISYLLALGSGIIEWEWRILVLIPLVIMGSSLLNGLIWAAYQLMASKIEYYKNINGYNEEVNNHIENGESAGTGMEAELIIED